MIITINKGALQGVLATVGKRASQTEPHLACIHIDAGDGEAAFSATNLNESARSVEPVLVEERGECLIPAKRLGEIVKSLPDQAVTIEAHRDRASIRCGRANFDIPALDPEDFPGTIRFNAESSARIGFCYFCEMVKKCEAFAAKDGGKPILTGILLDAGGGTLRMVATDSYRMICCESPCDAEFRVVVPASFAASVASAKSSTGSVRLSYDENFVMVENGGTVLATRRIEGTYPAWERLIPESVISSAEIDCKDIAGAVRRAATIGRGVPVAISYGGGTARIESAGDEGRMSEEVACSADGEGAIKVNASYAAEAIGAMGGGKVRLGFNGELKPLLVDSPDSHARAIIMPVR